METELSTNPQKDIQYSSGEIIVVPNKGIHLLGANTTNHRATIFFISSLQSWWKCISRLKHFPECFIQQKMTVIDAAWPRTLIAWLKMETLKLSGTLR